MAGKSTGKAEDKSRVPHISAVAKNTLGAKTQSYVYFMKWEITELTLLFFYMIQITSMFA